MLRIHLKLSNSTVVGIRPKVTCAPEIATHRKPFMVSCDSSSRLARIAIYLSLEVPKKVLLTRFPLVEFRPYWCYPSKCFIIQEFYRDFLVKTGFVLVALMYIYSLINLADNGKCNKPNLIFVACFRCKVW